jgi:hypothetical protein
MKVINGLSEIVDAIKSFTRNKSYGTIVISFEEGTITGYKETKQRKIVKKN